ncbi:helix-turn-helix domain-containing protein [Bacteroides timonensis]|uniref:helix-turn-helix domain-containing protein n=1 Tax=Bacteroides timonensis TaxID=1470345 RepID=UPI0004BB5E27|nr:helix-turn-helix domain-containing protein [Bacteroides timonensis]
MENTDYQFRNEKSSGSQVVTPDNNERIKAFFSSLDRLSGLMEKLFTDRQATLNGESFYTDRELSQKLKVSRRSLQDYRNQGRIPYIQLGGKILYRSSDIEKILEDGYRKALK